ncbi:MAG: hypothetical protein ACI978_001968 [Oleispira sp.]
MKSVLVVSKIFFPDKGARAIQALRFVKALASTYKVTVLTASAPSAGELEYLGVEIISVSERCFKNKLVNKYITKSSEHLFPFLGFIWSRNAVMALNDQHFDIVLSLSSPVDSHLVASTIKRKFKNAVKWGAFYSDPWPYSILPSSYRRKYPIFSYLQEILARSLLFSCDFLLYTNNNVSNYVSNALKVDVKSKSYVVPHLISNDKLDVKLEDSALRIVHAGHLTKERISSRFFKGFKLFLQTDAGRGFKLVFIGKTDASIAEKVDDNALHDNVLFLGLRDQDYVVDYLRKSFASIIFEGDLPENPFIPSKLADASSVLKPVVALTNAGSSIFKEFPSGGFVKILLHSDTPEIISDKLVRFTDKFKVAEANYSEYFQFYDNNRLLSVLDGIIKEKCL